MRLGFRITGLLRAVEYAWGSGTVMPHEAVSHLDVPLWVDADRGSERTRNRKAKLVFHVLRNTAGLLWVSGVCVMYSYFPDNGDGVDRAF